MKKENIVIISSLLVFLLGSIFVYFSGVIFISCISSMLSTIIRLYPTIIVAPLVTAVIYFVYQQLFTKRFSKKGLIIASSILGFFALSGLIMMFVDFSYYFQNEGSIVYTIITFLFNVGLLAACVTLLVLSLKNKLDFSSKDPILLGYGKPIKKIGWKIVAIVALCVSLFFFGDFLVGAFTFSIYTSKYYVLMLLAALIASSNIFYCLLIKGNKISHIVYIVLDLFVVIFFLSVIPADFGGYLDACAFLFLLDYASSIYFGPIFLALLSLGSIAYYVVSLVKEIKPKKE